MNSSISFHPASLAIGLVLGGIALLSMAPTVVPTPLRVEYLAHPRDFVQIKQGMPYTVPQGKLFVLIGLGATTGVSDSYIYVNGLPEVATTGCSGTSSLSVRGVPSGLTIAPGSLITVSASAGGGEGRAWGYLAPQ
ncbi:MAG: hypothetical protein ACKVXR_15480 [Planctomycetota bacterium]